uniref:Candidate secreted effector n=1 Tax=Meloidogyne incognita TaxID=6306 RepID=A0A914L4G2_MELIC
MRIGYNLLAGLAVRRVPPLEDIDDELIEEPQINEEDGDNNDGFILAKKNNKKRKLPKPSTDAASLMLKMAEQNDC